MLSRNLISKSQRIISNSIKRYSTSSIVVSSSTQKLNISTKNNSNSNIVVQKSNNVIVENLINNNNNNIYSNFRFYSTKKPIQFNLADVGEGIAECEVLKWYLKEGDTVKEFDRLCDVQSDKATVEITSRYDGVITKLYHKIGDMAKVGSPLVDILQEGSADIVSTEQPKHEQPKQQHTTHQPQQQQQQYHHDNHHVLATPSVRHMAKINNLNLKTISGSGKEGRVLKEDVLNYLAGGQQQQQQQQQQVFKVATTHSAPVLQTQAPVIIDNKQREQRVPITGIRKIMVKTMTAAASIPHFGYAEEYIMDGLMELRAQLKPLAESRGVKLSYLPFILKAASLALLKYPVLNSSLSPSETEIIYKNYHNIGVAMDTPQGLIVPNVKNVESKSIFEIAQELNRLQKLALAGQLGPHDLTGGTFTLSNIGTIGGTYTSPVIVLPEVCIGAIGKIQKLPRYDKNGQVHPVHITHISWSGDHRIIDGATIANFSNLLKNYMEHPNSMLFDTK
ncbi:dihydrolipoyl transacylase [Tieghemostelium lacteum]|uniref:Dihydrolipoamide acetyltransferase component of pyruvate dehydrogenase complex n=1 Tax=Tieghemostelium lacteum TaxID=361077 RepID=A0A151ZH72_TIELA|nr:dihydrolipoyl transacylase [Tieghemostelium lacteum]|eukprot:KYQ93259.1 dihydrolipoyl transacylase [Tieghemostelium lacteum]